MKQIQIYSLGYPQVIVNGRDITEKLSQKALALLIYIAALGGMHPRLDLAGLLWGEMNDDRARANLRSTLHNLRQVLPELIDGSRQALALATGVDLWLDCHALLERSRQQEYQPPAQDFEGFFQSYRGEFLEGFYVDSAPEFEAWVLEQREQLRLAYLHFLERTAAQAETDGKWELALEVTRRILTLEPWLESAQRRMMLLLARSGHCNQALAQFETCRVVLDQELDISPEPETWRLYEMIKYAAYCQAHNLPAFPTPFIGRESELAILERWIQNQDCRLITITGLGGIGKTRLAVELARRAVCGSQRAFLHGARYVLLPERISPDQFIPLIAQAIGVPLSESVTPAEQLFAYLRGKEMLLLIDSPGTDLVDSLFIARVLREIPGIKFLVISHAQLNLHWEWRFSVQGLPYPGNNQNPQTLAELRQYDAALLFLENARRVPHHFSSVESLRTVAKICRLAEGMPLALELAAARLRTSSPTQVYLQLDSNPADLQAEFVDLPDRHRNLARLFAADWEKLAPREQVALTRLAACPAGFDRDTARVLGGLTGDDLERLVDLSYVHRSAAGDYKLPELLRRFASLQVAQSLQLSQDTLAPAVY